MGNIAVNFGAKEITEPHLEDLRISKKLAAFEQLQTAIGHCNRGNWICAVTLAAAAEGILPEPEDTYLFQQLRESATAPELNKFINWLKHHDVEPDEVVLSSTEVVIVMLRAISKFISAYREVSAEMHEFDRFGRSFLGLSISD